MLAEADVHWTSSWFENHLFHSRTHGSLHSKINKLPVLELCVHRLWVFFFIVYIKTVERKVQLRHSRLSCCKKNNLLLIFVDHQKEKMFFFLKKKTKTKNLQQLKYIFFLLDKVSNHCCGETNKKPPQPKEKVLKKPRDAWGQNIVPRVRADLMTLPLECRDLIRSKDFREQKGRKKWIPDLLHSFVPESITEQELWQVRIGWVFRCLASHMVLFSGKWIRKLLVKVGIKMEKSSSSWQKKKGSSRNRFLVGLIAGQHSCHLNESEKTNIIHLKR